MKTYKHLSQEQRYHIYALRKAGFSQKEIAQEIQVSPSTICREIRRNQGLKGYRPQQAHRYACIRRSHAARLNVYEVPETTKQKALELIRLDWSPEQISQYLKKSGQRVSHETIYQWLIEDRLKGGNLYTHLRRRQRKYNRRHGRDSGRGFIKDRVPIEQRSSKANNRLEYGHWEADTVLGNKTKGAVLVTLVERKSRFLLTAKAPSKSAKDVTQAILKATEPYKAIFRSITFDNGKEFAWHKSIGLQLNCKTYFATAYHSWERGTNENTNGLLRQYFPKGKSLNDVTDEDVKRAQDRINHRPKRVLGYNAPEDVFNQVLKHYQKRHQLCLSELK